MCKKVKAESIKQSFSKGKPYGWGSLALDLIVCLKMYLFEVNVFEMHCLRNEKLNASNLHYNQKS